MTIEGYFYSDTRFTLEIGVRPDPFLSRSNNLKPPPVAAPAPANNNNNNMMMVNPQHFLSAAARREFKRQQKNQEARRVYERNKLNLLVGQGTAA